MVTPGRLARSVLAWPVSTQQGSRRNALVASTALTQRRREREEVEEFLQARFGQPLGASRVAAAPTVVRRGVI